LQPILVNPCSYKSLETVLDTIVAKTEKQWVAIGCDGLPFSLCSKMIENYFICPHCNESFTKKVQFINHINQENLDIEIENCKKYKNILLIPGMGHIDINNTKALFKLRG